MTRSTTHHSPLMRFCDECGLANELEALQCASCQHPFVPVHLVPPTILPPVVPLTITPPPVLEVTPDALLITSKQSMSGDFPPGTILAERYHIQEELGRGGFSIVYRAVDLDVGQREVAIKRIHLTALTPRQIIEATETFNREITMLAHIKWMNGVPRFYEHFIDAENWYLIMEYIPGQTLEDFLQKAPGGYLSEEETIDLGIRLTKLLHKLHQANPPVIFRDLKPANIMLTSTRELFLIDFGIARNFSAGKMKDTIPLGTPGYAAPEQYGRAQTEPRSDIYSLGATLQTLLTGRDPLELRAGEPSRNPQAPSPAMRKLLDKMLSSRVSQRPPSMPGIETRLLSIKIQGGFRGGTALGGLGVVTIFLFFSAIWAMGPLWRLISPWLGLGLAVYLYVKWVQKRTTMGPSFFKGLVIGVLFMGLYFALLGFVMSR